MLSPTLVFQTVLVGVLATAVMDAWLWLLQRLGVPTAGFAMVGRWVGHMARGRLMHAAIARAAPVRFELALGSGSNEDRWVSAHNRSHQGWNREHP